MQLNVVKNEVVSLLLRETTEESDIKKDESRLDLGLGVEFNNKNFCVIFNIRLIFDKKRELNILYKTIFDTDEDITQEFMDGKFPYINAPAIAFPFLRAYISNITMMSGYSVVMLPSVNFVKMYEEKNTEIVRINNTKNSNEDKS